MPCCCRLGVCFKYSCCESMQLSQSLVLSMPLIGRLNCSLQLPPINGSRQLFSARRVQRRGIPLALHSKSARQSAIVDVSRTRGYQNLSAASAKVWKLLHQIEAAIPSICPHLGTTEEGYIKQAADDERLTVPSILSRAASCTPVTALAGSACCPQEWGCEGSCGVMDRASCLYA